MKVLQLNSSVRGENSVSSQWAAKVSEKLLKQGHSVQLRDLVKNPVSVLDDKALNALFSSDSTSPVVQEYNTLIEELLEQDILVLGVPMYNFSIPTQLKNYFDAVARAGVTFKYTPTGVVGLTNVKKAYVVLSRGGQYKASGYLFQEQYIEMFLKFLGVAEIEFLFVEGLNMGESVATEALKVIEAQVDALIV